MQIDRTLARRLGAAALAFALVFVRPALLRYLLTAGAAGAASMALVSTGSAPPPPVAPFAPMAEHGLSNETPAGSPVARDPEVRARAIAASQRAAEQTTSGADHVPEPAAGASPDEPGCRTDTVRNWSSRHGARPALLVAHYTVSTNRAGWGDVDAIVRYFDDTRAQASSNYVIDFEGHCAYIVPETAKAWTQGFFNPWSISIEFVATGRERVWDERALRRGAQVFAAAAKRWGIPIRAAATDGCRIVRSGITDHDALGCGNTHTDVRPYFPMPRFIELARQAAGKPTTPRYVVTAWRPGLATAVRSTTTRPGERVAFYLRTQRMTRVSVRPAS